MKLHTAGWTLGQGEELFTNVCFRPRAAAIEKTARGTRDPMYGY